MNFFRVELLLLLWCKSMSIVSKSLYLIIWTSFTSIVDGFLNKERCKRWLNYEGKLTLIAIANFFAILFSWKIIFISITAGILERFTSLLFVEIPTNYVTVASSFFLRFLAKFCNQSNILLTIFSLFLKSFLLRFTL